ncbi:MAG: bifunctional diaminohydroxyphosphoribosylaminopyrimidine deaminase/5-amino-6-(5-phosphoribosylamino)uracil reductase RibD [Cryomorphaceae bacterium]
MNEHEPYMKRCLWLAAKGSGNTAPNPLVGSVLVAEGRIVGSGYHRAYGGPHAEVHAIESVRDKSILRKCTLYVNLEPCAHHGKTPPCADLIIRSEIPRVVVGQTDPNPLTAGKGIERMRAAGIEVITGVLEEECRHLNRRFNTFHSLGRPYVVLKWARSADGFMDTDREESKKTGIHWISHPAVKKLVHKRRTLEGAIMVGAVTLANDDPSLTARSYFGRQPQRFVLSHRGILPAKAKIFHDGVPVEVVSHRGGPASPLLNAGDNLTWTSAPAETGLIEAALASMHAQGINSVLVEGGRETLNGFIELNLWDEAMVITAPHTLGKGLPAPSLPLSATHSRRYATDLINTYYNR